MRKFVLVFYHHQQHQENGSFNTEVLRHSIDAINEFYAGIYGTALANAMVTACENDSEYYWCDVTEG